MHLGDSVLIFQSLMLTKKQPLSRNFDFFDIFFLSNLHNIEESMKANPKKTFFATLTRIKKLYIQHSYATTNDLMINFSREVMFLLELTGSHNRNITSLKFNMISTKGLHFLHLFRKTISKKTFGCSFYRVRSVIMNTSINVSVLGMPVVYRF